MAAYITRSDLESRFGQANLAHAACRDELDANVVIAAAISGAGELIDGYLSGGGYALPLVPAPALVAEIALDISWYKLWSGAIPEEVTSRYKDALRQLSDIQYGRIALQVLGAEIQPVDSDTQVLIDEQPRAFNAPSMRGY